MGARPLRQHYDTVTVSVDESLCDIQTSWRQHRDRFIAALGALDDGQRKATTRCTAWDAKDVLTHLISADNFFVFSLSTARTGAPPAKFLEGFNPSSSLDGIIAAARDKSFDEQLEGFVASTGAFAEEQAQWSSWDAPAESPFGHLPARFILAHAFWDSWLHERDVMVPLGLAPAIDVDELLVATWFSFFVAGSQGGLLGDPAPVGPGLTRPVDVTLQFDDLPGLPLRLVFDDGVRIERGAEADAKPAGSALETLEYFAGRRPDRAAPLPDDELDAQCMRAAQIL
jgi:uncharacterized protein (TIGR03083 family)